MIRLGSYAYPGPSEFFSAILRCQNGKKYLVWVPGPGSCLSGVPNPERWPQGCREPFSTKLPSFNWKRELETNRIVSQPGLSTSHVQKTLYSWPLIDGLVWLQKQICPGATEAQADSVAQQEEPRCPERPFLSCLCSVGPSGCKHRSSGFCKERRGHLLVGEEKWEAALGPSALSSSVTLPCSFSLCPAHSLLSPRGAQLLGLALLLSPQTSSGAAGP